MADERIEDITATITAIAADDLFVAIDASNTAEDPQGTTSKIAAATMGILATNNQTITTADVTGEVGQMYVCTIAGLTANRNLTLPSASAGDRIGVHVVDGDDTYALVLIGAASQTINGGSAATEWSRVFIKGETVIFRCIAANTWIVEHDSRIPQRAMMRLTTSATGETASTITTPTSASGAWSSDHDNASITTLASGRFTVRRNGVYRTSGSLYPASSVFAAQSYNVYIAEGATPNYITQGILSPGVDCAASVPVLNQQQWDSGTYLFLRYMTTQGSRGCLALASPRAYCYFAIQEVL